MVQCPISAWDTADPAQIQGAMSALSPGRRWWTIYTTMNELEALNTENGEIPPQPQTSAWSRRQGRRANCCDLS